MGNLDQVRTVGVSLSLRESLPRSRGPLRVPQPIQALPAFAERMLVGGPNAVDSAKLAKDAEAGAGTILVVEDDPPMEMMYVRAFSRVGYEVLTANDGASALVTFEKHRDRIDVVISDEQLPGLRGTDIARTIRGKLDDRVPLIIITACETPEKALEVLQAGGNDYLVKPPHFPELMAKVSNLARLRQAERKLSQANRHLEDDLKAASSYQASLLPEDGFACKGVKSAWHYTPCHYVAGDILNICEIDDHHVGFYLADVSGHGVPAAMLSVWLYTRLLALPGRPCAILRPAPDGEGFRLAEPGDVCAWLDTGLDETGTGKYATAFYADFDIRTRKLRYCRAGHPAPVLVRARDQSCVRLEEGGAPVGMNLGLPFMTGEITIEPGDRLYMFSDGLIELQDEDQNPIDGEDLLVRTIAESNRLELRASLQATMDHMTSKYVVDRDDLTMFAVEF